MIPLDDESVPLWVRIEECMRLTDKALAEAKRRGRIMVKKEAAYYTAKAKTSFTMLEAGYANTYIQQTIKGQTAVSEAMSEYHAAEVEYKNACEAVQVYKLKMRVLEAQYEREWARAGKE